MTRATDRNGESRSTSLSSESTTKTVTDLQANFDPDKTKDLPVNPPKKGAERLRAEDAAYARMLNVISSFEAKKSLGNNCGPGKTISMGRTDKTRLV